MSRDAIAEALQQMQGYKLGRWGADPIELVSSMGLRKEEWEHIKKEEESGNLDEDDIEEINEYFANSEESV